MHFSRASEKNAAAYNQKAQEWKAALQTNVGHKYLEKPAMDASLPESLSGKNVLCIGVGAGAELESILKRNPKRVVGIDISEELLKITQEKFPNIELHLMDMHSMSFEENEFDFIYSSLTLHYSCDWDVLFKEIKRVLKSGGQLLFSTHNPDYWKNKPATGNECTNERGITLAEHTALIPGGIEIMFYNHPNRESIKSAIEHAGFSVDKIFEPDVVKATPLETEIRSYEELSEKNSICPLFLVIRATKM